MPLTQEQYDHWYETATFKNQEAEDDFGADLPLKDYFLDGEMQILNLMAYDQDALNQLLKNPEALGTDPKTNEPYTTELFQEKLNRIEEKYNFYNRPATKPKDDPQPFSSKLWQNVKTLLSTPIAQPGLAPPSTPIAAPKYNTVNENVLKLQERGFSGYEEYDDPNRNVVFKGFDFDSLRNLSYFMPRNKTERDLNFALGTISERTGVDQGKAYWTDPSKPELGIQIENPETKETSSFNLPYFTPWRDTVDWAQTEVPAFALEYLAYKYTRGGAKRIFQEQKVGVNGFNFYGCRGNIGCSC